jgi:DNA-binding transcriptional LysR family regulator
MTTNNVIDVKRLRYLVAACQASGFSHAANAMGVAQPAFARHLCVFGC